MITANSCSYSCYILPQFKSVHRLVQFDILDFISIKENPNYIKWDLENVRFINYLNVSQNPSNFYWVSSVVSERAF